jgi:hypothetical protein
MPKPHGAWSSATSGVVIATRQPKAMTNRKASFSSASGAGRLMKAKDCRPSRRVVRGSVGDITVRRWPSRPPHMRSGRSAQ